MFLPVVCGGLVSLILGVTVGLVGIRFELREGISYYMKRMSLSLEVFSCFEGPVIGCRIQEI